MVRLTNKNVTKAFMGLSVMYCFLLMLSNIMTSKLINVFGVTVTGSLLVFPLVYIISDIMTEVYGMRLSMISIRLNALCSLIFAIMMATLIGLPCPPSWEKQEALAALFSSTPRIVVASLISYYFGDWLNSSVISWMKVRQGGKGFAKRAIYSTVVGQIADTGFFMVIAFAGVMGAGELFKLAVAEYCVKVCYEAACVPITAYVVKLWKKWDNMDVYDSIDAKTYNPFGR